MQYDPFRRIGSVKSERASAEAKSPADAPFRFLEKFGKSLNNNLLLRAFLFLFDHFILLVQNIDRYNQI